MAKAVVYLHTPKKRQKGAVHVHGDIKARNVLVDLGPKGTLHAYLTDFGGARVQDLIESGFSTSSSRYGTPGYKAPERYECKDVSEPAIDVYSFGGLIVEVCMMGLRLRHDVLTVVGE